MTMTLDRRSEESRNLEVIEATPLDEILAELPDPYQDEAYLKAVKERDKLEAELANLRQQKYDAEQDLKAVHVRDYEDAADQELEVEALQRRWVKLRKAVEYQQGVVADELRRAKREFQRAAKEAWVSEFVPELTELMYRILEIRNAYRTLKTKGGGVMNPPFPAPLERAIGSSDVWLKARAKEWFQE